MIAIPVRLSDYTECHPVLKWAGGKGQLLEQIEQKLPLKLKMNSIKRYIEPFVGGGGSKLKSTAGEYADIYHQWTKDGHQFIWLTDGFGWQKTQRPLRDTFNTTYYILNIAMVQKGVLEELLK